MDNELTRAYKKKTPHQRLRNYCDKLWSKIIIRKAGGQSEFSGKLYDPEAGVYLVAHHLIGKPHLALRYSIQNGFCLTLGEHRYIAHHTGRQKIFRNKVIELRGPDTFERLQEIQPDSRKLLTIKDWLEALWERI